MTAEKPQWGVQITVWRWNKTTVCLDWRTVQTGWLSSPPAKGQHIRVLLDYAGDLTPAHMTLLAQRMSMYVLAKKSWKVSIAKGFSFREVGGEAAPVPPSGGEGGEKPQDILPGQEALPGLDTDATIISPAPPVKQESDSEPKARRRSSAVDRARTKPERPVKRA